MKVLYVSHSGEVSGAERCLLDLLAGLGSDVTPVVACPQGALAAELDRVRVAVARIPAVRAGARWHPWFTLRALADLGRAALAVRRLMRGTRLDLVHANSIRAGIVAAFAAWGRRPPLVIAINDCLPATGLAGLARRLVSRRASTILANSHYTADHFLGGRQAAKVAVVYNPLDLERFDPTRVSRAAARAMLGLPDGVPVLAVVAQITPWKGQDDAIRALALVRRTHGAASLLLVGGTKFVDGGARYDNAAYGRSLRELAISLGVAGAVGFMGERADIPQILAAVDIVLAPSWEEPFGLAVIEAMAMAVPVIATSVGGPAEIITSAGAGMLLPPRRPQQWAAAVEQLLADPARRRELGRNGRAVVLARFGRRRYVEDVLGQYRKIAPGWSA